MKKRLKCLDETIAEIEKEIEKNPDRFLISTLERLKLYRDYSVDSLIDKVTINKAEYTDLKILKHINLYN